MPVCALCEREVKYITKHHLVPKQKGGTFDQTIDLCSPCHKTIHAIFSNTILVQRFKTIDKLKEAVELQDYLKWIRKRDIEKLPVKRRKNKK